MKTQILTILALFLSLGAFAQSNDTMFVVKKGQVAHEFATQEVDSII